MQSTVDPGEAGSESLATSLAGELERLRFSIKDLSDFVGFAKAQWYSTPTGTIPSAKLATVAIAQGGTGATTAAGARTNLGVSEMADSEIRVVGSADATKKLAFEVDGFTTGTTRTATPPNYDHRVMSQTKGADIASAATINLDTATGDLVDVTGITTITTITLAEGKMATVRFTGVLTLTNGASLVLPGAANILTAAGDFAIFRGYATGVVRCVSYIKADGTPVINANGTTITLGTEQATTSGTSIDFTGIPSWVKRITVMFNAVSTNGTSIPIIQIGDSGGIETTGYVAGSELSDFTAGFGLVETGGAANALDGALVLSLEDSSDNTWVAHGATYITSVAACAGRKALSATLDRVRLTTVNGTDTFDAGAINISYE